MLRAFLLIFLTQLFFQADRRGLDDRLCGANEDLLFSFLLQRNGKVVSLCREKAGAYLVYRSGSRQKVELQYPALPDTASWKAFHLRGARRFGGAANAGFGDYRIFFSNKGVTYELFDSWSDEDGSKDIGISVTVAGKKTMLKGNVGTKKGSLLRLDDDAARLPNEANDD